MENSLLYQILSVNFRYAVRDDYPITADLSPWADPCVVRAVVYHEAHVIRLCSDTRLEMLISAMKYYRRRSRKLPCTHSSRHRIHNATELFVFVSFSFPGQLFLEIRGANARPPITM